MCIIMVLIKIYIYTDIYIPINKCIKVVNSIHISKIHNKLSYCCIGVLFASKNLPKNIFFEAKEKKGIEIFIDKRFYYGLSWHNYWYYIIVCLHLRIGLISKKVRTRARIFVVIISVVYFTKSLHFTYTSSTHTS